VIAEGAETHSWWSWPGNPLNLRSLGFPGPKTIPHLCGFTILSGLIYCGWRLFKIEIWANSNNSIFPCTINRILFCRNILTWPFIGKFLRRTFCWYAYLTFEIKFLGEKCIFWTLVLKELIADTCARSPLYLGQSQTSNFHWIHLSR
jgi:hypothetical protein